MADHGMRDVSVLGPAEVSQIRDTNPLPGMVDGPLVGSNELMTSVHPSTSQLSSDAGRIETARIAVGIGPLSFADVVAVARHGARIEISADALGEVRTSRAIIEGLADDVEPHYGVSTGFGALATKHIAPDMRAQLQRSLVRSHAAGSGPEVEREVIRALMLLRLSTLTTGRTGVREETAAAYAGMLNAGITPVVHEYGSLGCSGDLAPLAHCALAVMGEGPVRDASGELTSAADALSAAGITPIALREKEGLALINGTDGMLGMLVLAITDLGNLLKVADLTAAMSVEGLLGTDAVFAADLQALRPHPGQAASAGNIRAIMAGSPIRASHDNEGCTRVQDAYSLRCAPQVAGAARDTVDHAARVAGWELAAAVDNPVITLDGRVESNGNFHGAPVAYVLDFLAIVAADVASMSERRTDRFLDVSRNHGLNAFLADDPGVDSGHMIAQYTAAGIVSEMKRLAAPASVDSIPSSAMQEDHVSMGWAGARKLRRSVDGLTRVLAVELLTAARGIQLRAPLEPSAATGAVINALREVTEGPGVDRFMAPEIEATVQFVATGGAVRAVESVTGPLN
jgi:histidine ammonia-lyase